MSNIVKRPSGAIVSFEEKTSICRHSASVIFPLSSVSKILKYAERREA